MSWACCNTVPYRKQFFFVGNIENNFKIYYLWQRNHLLYKLLDFS